MLYKVDPKQALAKRAPIKTARQNIAKVARALGAGSTPRAMLEWAKANPDDFWTKLYAKTVERDAVNIQVNTGPQMWTIGDKEVEF